MNDIKLIKQNEMKFNEHIKFLDTLKKHTDQHKTVLFMIF